ncbi:hypothetical protein EAH89_02865 [Roseomonas nepalensis]|uniref:Uncharacterized protein n=1 Tax=Muricoccus nepalensis TaxID=1854500 RepID=A0A502GE05_9PROT|nr:hypothetical protein [Roseomonas nepalensis]TPG60339.1 hypothetical protein EAH89_02865 [Roseomonas nepalensis]
MSETGEEEAILARLAAAHRRWRDAQPAPPPPPSWEEMERLLHDLHRQVEAEMANPEPPDVVALREAAADPAQAAIVAQLRIVGWRLYAKGGATLLERRFQRLERDAHPGFAGDAQRAWTGIGFADRPGGVWKGPGH